MVQRVKGQTRSGVVDRRTVFRAGSGVRELLLADWRKRFGPSSDMGSILSRGQSEAAGRNRRCGPPLRCGQVSSPVGVERVDADALSSLTCAGWLPQDRGFEVGVWPLV